jgi:hypothetical protein
LPSLRKPYFRQSPGPGLFFVDFLGLQPTITSISLLLALPFQRVGSRPRGGHRPTVLKRVDESTGQGPRVHPSNSRELKPKKILKPLGVGDVIPSTSVEPPDHAPRRGPCFARWARIGNRPGIGACPPGTDGLVGRRILVSYHLLDSAFAPPCSRVVAPGGFDGRRPDFNDSAANHPEVSRWPAKTLCFA